MTLGAASATKEGGGSRTMVAPDRGGAGFWFPVDGPGGPTCKRALREHLANVSVLGSMAPNDHAFSRISFMYRIPRSVCLGIKFIA